MKRIYLLFASLLVLSCNTSESKINNEKKEIIQQEIKDTLIDNKGNEKLEIEKEKVITSENNSISPISFSPEKGTAVLIGESIKLLNENLEIIDSLNLKQGSFVNIIAKSDSLYNNKEYCDAFNYLKVRNVFKNGIMDGRDVYKISDAMLDTLDSNQKKIKLFRTEFYGIGVSDEEGLTFCANYNEPVVFKDESKSFFGLVEIVKDSVFEKATWNKKVDFLELMANDGAYDKVKNITFTENGIILKINRSFQEGFTNFDLLLKYENGKYKAKYLNYPETKYEEY
ncbi:hypothetical protein [Aureivirga sp. CE67]|uniref:hypothetical protein n=1 Tax=Aureivirga sp. CE67 TaxID=1788983 RepID=UPI0018C8E1CE|nr:hypothetical protein [Aureivirga sp. CE67]